MFFNAAVKELPKYLLGYHNCSKEDMIKLGGLLFRAKVDSDRSQFVMIPKMLRNLVPADQIKSASPEEWKKVSRGWRAARSKACAPLSILGSALCRKMSHVSFMVRLCSTSWRPTTSRVASRWRNAKLPSCKPYRAGRPSAVPSLKLKYVIRGERHTSAGD